MTRAQVLVECGRSCWAYVHARYVGQLRAWPLARGTGQAQLLRAQVTHRTPHCGMSGMICHCKLATAPVRTCARARLACFSQTRMCSEGQLPASASCCCCSLPRSPFIFVSVTQFRRNILREPLIEPGTMALPALGSAPAGPASHVHAWALPFVLDSGNRIIQTTDTALEWLQLGESQVLGTQFAVRGQADPRQLTQQGEAISARAVHCRPRPCQASSDDTSVVVM